MNKLGYDDTPVIPGSSFHVHDGNRPQPRVVKPGCSASMPPSDATVLFDGTGFEGWQGRDGEVKWNLAGGVMEVVPATGDIWTKTEFGSCQLHLEFRTPHVVKGEGQGRGNSGVFLMGRYEIQVLDCFENPTYPDGTTGAIYGQFPPLVNACRKPGAWSSYDILWEAPQFDGASLVKPAYVTVILNGVLLHHHKELQGPTEHRKLAAYVAHPASGPLKLQDHGDLVAFRNIWVRPIGTYDHRG
jgi:hypothetical protein